MHVASDFRNWYSHTFQIKGRSQTTLTRLGLFYPLPPWVDIFYGMNVDKKWTFLDHLPTSSCKRSFWTAPNPFVYMLPNQFNFKFMLMLKKFYSPLIHKHWFLLNTVIFIHPAMIEIVLAAKVRADYFSQIQNL